MTARGLGAAALAAVLGLVASCSATGIPAASQSSAATASVTQAAPSVWPTPETTGPSAAASGSSAAGGVDDTTSLPGLTSACSAAIRAQVAVNDLFAAALAAGAPATTRAPSTTEPSTSARSTSARSSSTRSSQGTASSAATAKTTLTTTATVRPAAVTEEQIQTVFDPIPASVAAELKPAFETLREAADKAVGKPAEGIPAILGSATVTAAADTIRSYIASCSPTTSG